MKLERKEGWMDGWWLILFRRRSSREKEREWYIIQLLLLGKVKGCSVKLGKLLFRKKKNNGPLPRIAAAMKKRDRCEYDDEG